MIELIQFPWSPYCIVQRRILEYSGTRFKVVNISNVDRTLVWKVTQERYYQVPVVRNGKTVVFETGGMVTDVRALLFVSLAAAVTGFLVGGFYPLGLSRFGTAHPALVTWAMAVNTGFTVCGSLIAIDFPPDGGLVDGQ